MSSTADSTYVGTRPVSPLHAFDEGKLAAFIRDQVTDFPGALTVSQFKGGQSNPTFLVQAGTQQYVLRRKPPGVLLPSAHAVDREFKVISALAGTDVPVAKAHALCQDPEVIGTDFYLMDYVPGRIFWDPKLPDVPAHERPALYDELNRVIAALHRVNYQPWAWATTASPASTWPARWRAGPSSTVRPRPNALRPSTT